MSPVAVMSGSSRQGLASNRFEELVVEKLTSRLRLQHDMYSLTRQNWFELREGRPLSFDGQSPARRELLRHLRVYEVKTSADAVLEQIRVQVVAYDAQGQVIPGVVAEKGFDEDQDGPWQKLYAAGVQSNAFPEGLEERPYTSVDRFAYSLAAELTNAYRSGIQADGFSVSESEVNVVLYAKNPTPQTVSIQNALQQAIVGQRGFTSAVSQEDLGAVFGQLDAYRRNNQVFDLEPIRFAPGTVLLMIEAAPHRDGDKIGVALRSLWRVSPLESDSGELIPTSVAGTYLSGFAAKAYLSGPIPGQSSSGAGGRFTAPNKYTPKNQYGFE
jgi:hypothetical protein